jgi:antitoxin HicB
MHYKIPLVLTPQPEGGYTVTSPLLPELVTEGDTIDEALTNAKDALAAVVELHDDKGRQLP